MGIEEQKSGLLQGIQIGDILRVLWKYKAVIAIVTGVFLGLGIFINLRAKPVYSSVSKFVCSGGENSKMADLGALASLAGIKTGSPTNTNPSLYFSEIIEDDDFLGKILQKKWAYRGDSASLMDIYSLKADTSQADWQYVFWKNNIGKLKGSESISLTKNRSNGIFILETHFSDPKLAFQVNLYVIELLSDYLRTSLLTKTREKRNFIEKRLSEIESDLVRDEDRFTDFQQRNKDVYAPTVVLQRARFERSVRINQELYLQMKKEFEMAKIEEKNDTPLLEVLSKPSVPIGKTPGKGRFLIIAGLGLGLGLGAISALGFAWYKKEWA